MFFRYLQLFFQCISLLEIFLSCHSNNFNIPNVSKYEYWVANVLAYSFLTFFNSDFGLKTLEAKNKRKNITNDDNSYFVFLFIISDLLLGVIFSDDDMDMDNDSLVDLRINKLKKSSDPPVGEKEKSLEEDSSSLSTSIFLRQSFVVFFYKMFFILLSYLFLVESHALKDNTLSSNPTSIPIWKDLMRNENKGRSSLSEIWNGRQLARTAKFILNNQASPIEIIRKLYDRLIYLYNTFPNDLISQNKSLDSAIDKEDLDWMNEIEIELDKNISYLLFEGKNYLSLDEFGVILFSRINPKDISKDFPIRNLGAGRFIVGLINPPFIDSLSKKLVDLSISSISHEKMLDLINSSNEKTGGVIFFLNGKLVTYVEVQSEIAKLKSDIKSLIKRVFIKKEMVILFVPVSKLHYFVEQVKYLEINNNIFKSIYNLAPEFQDDIGKVISKNCPFNKPALLFGYITRFCGIKADNIINIAQIGKSNVTSKGKRSFSYLVWVRGQKAIRRLLLSVIDVIKIPSSLGFFCWPKTKGENFNPVNCPLLEL